MKIVYANAILDCVVAKIIGRAVGHATLDAATGQPDRKTVRTVIAASTATELSNWESSKLTSPNYKGRVKQTTLLKIR